MERFFRHYDPKMPIYLGRKAEAGKFDPEAFVSWYLSFPDIRKVDVAEGQSVKFYRYLILYAYYVWVIYGLSGLLMLFIAHILGALALICSPFVVAGAIYTLLLAAKYLKLENYLRLHTLKDLEPRKKSLKKPKKRLPVDEASDIEDNTKSR